MADGTNIEWTDATWQVTHGCRIISPGCTNCYAMKMAHRLEAMGQEAYADLTQDVRGRIVWTGTIKQASDATLRKPLSWKKPRRIFVDSMADLFAEGVEDAWIDRAFAVMKLCPQHTFQVLTKRSARMLAYASARNGMGNAALCRAINAIPYWLGNRHGALQMPLPNVWLGVSVEDRARLGRVDDLRVTPAAVRFVSAEPLLQDLGTLDLTGIHQVIAGGESGPGRRHVDPDWMRAIMRQCAAAGVAFFGKQLDKVIPLPADLMVRQWPGVTP